MLCIHCQSPEIRKLNRQTDLGYAVFRCGDCGRKFNERTGTPFNFLEFPTDIVFEIVIAVQAQPPQSGADVLFRLSWKWRDRSPVKITESVGHRLSSVFIGQRN
jgi:hypothetical protein